MQIRHDDAFFLKFLPYLSFLSGIFLVVIFGVFPLYFEDFSIFRDLLSFKIKTAKKARIYLPAAFSRFYDVSSIIDLELG